MAQGKKQEESEDLMLDARNFVDSYKKEIGKSIKEGKKVIFIDFKELASFSHQLAEAIVNHPGDNIQILEGAVEESGLVDNPTVRLTNLSETYTEKIRNLRANHLNKLIQVEGIVRQASEVRPQVVNAKFECPSCGTIISVLQVKKKFKKPNRCSCGRKGNFKLLNKDMVDAQRLVVEETPEALVGGEQPRRVNVFLKRDLTEPKMEKKTTPGSKIKLIGVLKEIPITSRTGKKLTRSDIALEANNVIALEETFEELNINEEDERQIKELAASPNILDRFIQSVAPSIYGYEEIKKALTLQMFGGVRKNRTDGSNTRGDIHILLVGDPGVAKSVSLKYVSQVAPKGRYLSGKSATGAGITATVVRDEYLKGWSLEAGAMVLSNKGVVCIDELEKMGEEDRSTMHEALEQQSYHPDTEITLSNGKTKKISSIVDGRMKNRKDEIIRGNDCEMLPVEDLKVQTTDFEKIERTKVDRISRHTAPDYFIEIEYKNGRKIRVTPEHPIFIYKDGITTKRADEIKGQELSLAPKKYNLEEEKVKLETIESKKIDIPSNLDKELARLLGYIVTEGHTYRNHKNRYAEIGISNSDSKIIEDVERLFQMFNIEVNKNVREKEDTEKATKNLATVRCSSIPLYKFLKKNFEEVTRKSPKKRVPSPIKRASNRIQKEFLYSAFKGDGFIDSERFGFSTSSYNLAKDYQDLLLQNNIWNYIAEEKRKEKKYYKVVISGRESMGRFISKIAKKDKRKIGLNSLFQRSKQKRNDRDIVPPAVVRKIDKLLKDYCLDDGYFYKSIKNNRNAHRETVRRYVEKIEKVLDKDKTKNKTREKRKTFNIHVKDIASSMNVSPSTIYNIENSNPHHPKTKLLHKTINKKIGEKVKRTEKELEKIKKIINSDIRFIPIKKVRKVKNKDKKWVYDLTVEPNRNFISEGLILHNTVTISKANVQATLQAQTSVLAAANPKLGRFDPYKTVANQIDLPSTLINRFDVIFILKDNPEKAKDKAIANHVLREHQKGDQNKPPIERDLLRKYVAYARQSVFPEITDEVREKIKDFYVNLRNSPSGSEDPNSSVPISARQLEGLIRLSEAHARVRLSDKVEEKDAKEAIDLMKYYLMQVGYDYETKSFDIDRVATGVSTSERGRIRKVKNTLSKLESRLGKLIPIEELKEELEGEVEEDKIDEALQKLSMSGDIFHPKKGHVQRM